MKKVMSKEMAKPYSQDFRQKVIAAIEMDGRVNMIAAYCHHNLIAPFTVEGACNRTVFKTWIETCLIKCLKPGQWLIIDNATFHKGGRIAESTRASWMSSFVFAALLS